ncbi:MAG: hypothetical protein EXQ60_07060 [Candidatus Nanopelagicales bacterium]|nr:hypothetical protein [Candidatus Nanopelagicales bacterium]
MRLLDMHRWLGVTALAFLLLQMAMLLLDPKVAFTVPQLLAAIRGCPGHHRFWVADPVSILGRMRTRLGKAGNTLFKRVHLLAYAAWPLATAHYVLAGTDSHTEWSLAILIAGGALMIFALLARGFIPAPAPQRPVRKDPVPIP